MAGDIYSASGLSNAPLFINYQPFRLDFSPYRHNQEVMLQLMPQLAAAARQQRDQLIAAKAPDFGNQLPNDKARMERQWLQARQGMVSRLSRGNPNWVVANDPQFMAYQQDLIAAQSPSAIAAGEQVKVSHDAFRERMNKVPGSGNFPLFDPQGNPIVDPESRGRLLQVGDWNQRRPWLPSYDITGHGGQYSDLSFADPQETRDRFAKNLKPEGYTEWAQSSGGVEQLKDFIGDQAQDPMARVAAAVTYNQKRRTNLDQLSSAIASVKSTMDQSDRNGIFTAYVDTPGYRMRAQLPVEKGGFLRNGELDTQAAFQAMEQAPDFALGLKNKQGKEQGISYADKFVLDIANKFLVDSNIIDRNQSVIRGAKAPGAGGKAKVPYWQLMMETGPVRRTRMNSKGQPVEVGVDERHKKVERMVPVPVVYPGGQTGVEGSVKVPAYQEAMLPEAYDQLAEHIGLPHVQGGKAFVKYEEDDDTKSQSDKRALFPEAADALAGWETVGVNGKPIDFTRFANYKVVGMEKVLEFRPDYFGNRVADPANALSGHVDGLTYANQNSEEGSAYGPRIGNIDAAGGNAYNSLWVKVKIAVPEDGPRPTDYVVNHAKPLDKEGREVTKYNELRLRETDIDSRDYAGSGGFENQDGGVLQHEGVLTVFARVPESFIYDESFGVDAKRLKDFRDFSLGPEGTENPTTQGAEEVIQGVTTY